MFSRRTRLGRMKTRNTETNFEEERQSMLVDEEAIKLFVDPTPIAWPSFQEECERCKSGSTYSSPDIKEFRSLLLENGRDNTSSESPDYLQQKSLNRMPSRDANPWPAVLAKPSEKVTLPKLLVFEDDEIRSEQKQGRTVNSKLRVPMDHLPLECPKINRSGTKNVQSRLDLFNADMNTNENQRESANTAGTDAFLKRTLDRNGVSRTRRDIRKVSQLNKAKNDLRFSDLFVESGHVELSEKTSNWLNCGESESTAAGQTRKANERGTQIYKTFSDDEVYGNEVASRLTKESKDVVRELSKRGSDQFGDAQSQKSFVLVVDQLTDLRMRNRFVRQYAGRRRLAICEELEKGIVRDGQCLFELRKELTIANVLKNMFV